MNLIIFLIMLLSAGLIYYSNKKDRVKQWATLVLLCGSAYELGEFMNKLILPVIHENTLVIIQKYAQYMHHPLFRSELFIPLIITFSLVLFIFLGTKTKLMGFKIRLERHSFEYTIEAAISGTNMINHAIKNRIINIEMLTDQIKLHSQEIQHQEISDNSTLILSELEQMLEMVKHIQYKTQDTEYNVQINNLNQLIRNVIESKRHLCNRNNIQIHFEYAQEIKIYCDQIHLKETLYNMIQNALEVVQPHSGTVTIRLFQVKKTVHIHIEDNGSGIAEENMTEIFKPFFSTKHRTHNYGLGLCYCYMTIQKHGGNIKVQSQYGKGTTFSIQLPIRKGLRNDF